MAARENRHKQAGFVNQIERFFYLSFRLVRNLSVLSEGFPTCLPDRQARFACGNDIHGVIVVRYGKGYESLNLGVSNVCLVEHMRSIFIRDNKR
ncbi:MAG TPA: hypothetical protein VN328_06455 [Thermodesulfovibrionales bacterium]|nr:hypothetical protein [Thermodesulfovibrionales bacterium]